MCHIMATLIGLLYSFTVMVIMLWFNGCQSLVEVLFMLTLILGFYFTFWCVPFPQYQKSIAIGFSVAIAGFIIFVFPWFFFAR